MNIKASCQIIFFKRLVCLKCEKKIWTCGACSRLRDLFTFCKYYL